MNKEEITFLRNRWVEICLFEEEVPPHVIEYLRYVLSQAEENTCPEENKKILTTKT